MNSRARTAEQKARVPQKKVLALPPADPSLSAEGKVVSPFAFVAAMAKKIEPVGKFYAKL